MAEQRAEMDASQAASALEAATVQLQHASDRLDEATRWKSGTHVQGILRVGLYEQALLSEHVLGTAADAAEAAHVSCLQTHRARCDRLLEARRALEVADRRLERVQVSITEATERRASDDAADLWLSRRLHAER
ncbi:MAG TPA: hypothetical protein DEO93_06840 [Stenotrophomonas sp.]|nr:hypothetical protein [Stenotrophomonas sp.]